MNELSATPEKIPGLVALAKRLRQADEFARRPFGYENPPLGMLSNLLGLPAVAATAERMGYGEPLTTGKGMTTRLRPETIEAALAVAPGVSATKGLPVGGVIKPKGGNWLVSTGPESTLKQFKLTAPINSKSYVKGPEFESVAKAKIAEWEGKGREGSASNLKNILNSPSYAREVALNKWIEGPLTKYMKTEMGAPSDPLRLLADENVLKASKKYESALTQVQKEFDRVETLKRQGPKPNMPAGTFEQALADQTARAERAAERAKEIVELEIANALPVDPKGIVGNYDVAKQIKFLREKAGFPAEGMAQTPTGKAWENIIDQRIISGKAGEINNPLAFSQNPWLSKLDPETPIYHLRTDGDVGFNHILDELKNSLNPQSGLPKKFRLTPEQLGGMGIEKAARHVIDINMWRAAQKAVADAQRAQKSAVVHKEYPEGLRWMELKQLDETPGGQSLENLRDALKYEGETMRHCVGGYCEDVIGGKSRIFSLRDKKGQPHVTIETAPGRSTEGLLSQEELPTEVFADLKNRNLLDPNLMWRQNEAGNYVAEIGPFKDRILQIKGKMNQAPDEKYLPFVQDFVRSGKWSDVRDLQNTGLSKTADIFDPQEREILKSIGHETPDYYKPEEKENWIKAFYRHQYGRDIETGLPLE